MIQPTNIETLRITDEKRVTVKCHMCKKPQIVVMSETEFDNYYHKQMHVQTALSTHSVDDRELLISGTCPTCWNKLFGRSKENNN